jgi:uncharacterized 2Fe-2S/4Fe-4S cluster protein (DUF4445 family)
VGGENLIWRCRSSVHQRSSSAVIGVGAEEADEFIIAGAFGTYISVEAAIAIGMSRDIPLNRFRQVGNVAGIGAKQALLSKTRRAEAEEIRKRVEYLELTVSQRFQGEFLKAMYM